MIDRKDWPTWAPPEEPGTSDLGWFGNGSGEGYFREKDTDIQWTDFERAPSYEQDCIKDGKCPKCGVAVTDELKRKYHGTSLNGWSRKCPCGQLLEWGYSGYNPVDKWDEP